jgi:hypothetical protein
MRVGRKARAAQFAADVLPIIRDIQAAAVFCSRQSYSLPDFRGDRCLLRICPPAQAR